MRIPLNAQRGAELLDERLPGWPHVIDAEDLDVGNIDHCVLAQIFGDYNRGTDVLDVNGRTAYFGFAAQGRQIYDNLTAGWAALVEERVGV